MSSIIKMNVWNFIKRLEYNVYFVYLLLSASMITVIHLWGWGFIKIYKFAGCLMLLLYNTVFCGTLLSSGGLCMNCICSTTSTYKKEWIWSWSFMTYKFLLDSAKKLFHSAETWYAKQQAENTYFFQG